MKSYQHANSASEIHEKLGQLMLRRRFEPYSVPVSFQVMTNQAGSLCLYAMMTDARYITGCSQ